MKLLKEHLQGNRTHSKSSFQKIKLYSHFVFSALERVRESERDAVKVVKKVGSPPSIEQTGKQRLSMWRLLCKYTNRAGMIQKHLFSNI